MKKALLVILWLSSLAARSNSIDSLRTKKDVISFFNKQFPDTLDDRSWMFNSRDGLFNASDSFYVVDVDKNGANDLVLDNGVVSVVFDTIGGFKRRFIDTWSQFKGLRVTDTCNHLLASIYAGPITKLKYSHDTAYIIKYDEFVEHVPHPSENVVDSIVYEYEAGFCSECPRFSRMTLGKNGTCDFYTLDEYRSGSSGTVEQTILSEKELSNIHQLISHMKFETFPEKYGGRPFDVSVHKITVYYRNDKKNSLTTYGSGACASHDVLLGLFHEIYATKKKKQKKLTSITWEYLD